MAVNCFLDSVVLRGFCYMQLCCAMNCFCCAWILLYAAAIVLRDELFCVLRDELQLCCAMNCFVFCAMNCFVWLVWIVWIM